jgi:tetratricopeptide (TPR) repeat protein
LALYCAQKESPEKNVQYFLDLAAKTPEQLEEWRKEQVDAKIAQTNAFMEKSKQNSDSFDKETKELDELISTGNFDAIQSALRAYSNLFNRCYSNLEHRNIIENKIKSSWDKMPILSRIDFLTDMAGYSLDHKDNAKAIELVNDAQKLKESSTWPVRYEIPLIAKLAEMHFLAGDKEKARDELNKALNILEENREEIIDIYRAEVFRSIAEAYHAIGETDIARDIYKQAIDAGIENPNSRPRAEDLSKTCCSMALNAVKPGSELLTQIQQIKDALSAPW